MTWVWKLADKGILKTIINIFKDLREKIGVLKEQLRDLKRELEILKNKQMQIQKLKINELLLADILSANRRPEGKIIKFKDRSITIFKFN